MNKHTPGPWTAGRPDMQTFVDGVPSKWIYDDKGQYVAAASGRIDGPWEQVMANARLIAAAPDLLAVAEYALEVSDKWGALHQMATAAIAKARGKP